MRVNFNKIVEVGLALAKVGWGDMIDKSIDIRFSRMQPVKRISQLREEGGYALKTSKMPLPYNNV
ncbi:MAG: hypothetical protein ACXAD7_09320 [Candidatus Kariarchaeaceae archaeon]|jgi:hypothetical protein